jgi:hypothetical protein
MILASVTIIDLTMQGMVFTVGGKLLLLTIGIMLVAQASARSHGIDPNGPLTTRAEYFRALMAPSIRGRSDIETNVTNRYAVIFDAGSSGTRVYIYNFTMVEGRSSTLRLVGDSNKKTSPGISTYTNATQAAESLIPL